MSGESTNHRETVKETIISSRSDERVETLDSLVLSPQIGNGWDAARDSNLTSDFRNIGELGLLDEFQSKRVIPTEGLAEAYFGGPLPSKSESVYLEKLPDVEKEDNPITIWNANPLRKTSDYEWLNCNEIQNVLY